jgi:ParB family chromosome partitioning protein
MVREKRRISSLAAGAVGSQTQTLLQEKDSEIEALKTQLEEVANGNRGGDGWVEIPIDTVKPLSIRSGSQSVHQPRKYFDPVALQELAESIKEDGLKEPIVVRDTPEGYEMMDGARRHEAHKVAGLLKIKAYVRLNVSDEEALAYALTTDALKEKISPLEQAISVVDLLCLKLNLSETEVKSLLFAMQNDAIGKTNPDDRDNAHHQKAQIAHGVLNSIGVTLGTMVNSRLKFLDLAPKIRKALEAGQISPTNALLINKVDERYHNRLLKEGSRLSKKDLQALIAKLMKGERSTGVELENAFTQNPSSIYEQSITRMQELSQSPLIKEDTRARRMFLDIYERLNKLGKYVESKRS